MNTQVGSFGKVLAQCAVYVHVCGSLPWASRFAEADRRARGLSYRGVL